MKKYIFALATMWLSATSLAGDLSNAPVVFKSGNWTVKKATDAMTDKVSCVGILNNDFAIQLSDNSLYIRVRGGPQSVKYRLDDQAPSSIRMVSDIDRKIGVLELSGADLSSVLAAKRLRYEVFTVLDQIVAGDLDITGIDAVHDNIRAGCPGDAVADKQKNEAVAQCSDAMRASMKKKGLSDDAIADVCKGS